MKNNYGVTKRSIIFGIGPALLLYVGFVIIPILISIYYAFFSWDGLTAMKFVGFSNFKAILADKYFLRTVANTIIVVFSMVLIQLPLAFLIAIVVNEINKLAKIYRTLIFIPVTISAVVTSLIWNKIYNLNYGLLNTLLCRLGLESWAHNWLGDTNIAIFAVCIAIVWQGVGLYMVMYLAGLQSVSTEIVEAAIVDGASRFKRITRVIVPLLKPTIVVTVIYSISNSFRVFDLIYTMTKGGPNHSTEVMTIYMYQNSFVNSKFGYGSAVSILILLFSFLAIKGVTRLLEGKGGEDE
ncbi:MAG: sugar ABC transporter permease [Ruthenibacterium sp.]